MAHPLRYFAQKNPNMDRVYIFLPSKISGNFQEGIKFLCAVSPPSDYDKYCAYY